MTKGAAGRRPNAVIVLQAMLTGTQTIDGYTCSRTVHMDGRNWVLAEGETGPVPAIVATVEENGSRRTTLHGVPDLPLTAFVAMCNRLDDDEVFILGCETVLTRNATTMARNSTR
jgi:hypothetical protein